MSHWITRIDVLDDWFKISDQLCGGNLSTPQRETTPPEPQVCGSSLPSDISRSNKKPNVLDHYYNQNNHPEPYVLRTGPSLPLVEDSSLSSPSVIDDKRIDKQDIGPESLTDSDDDIEDERDETHLKNNRCNMRYVICIVLAFIFAVISTSLIWAMIIRKRNTSKSNKNVPNSDNRVKVNSQFDYTLNTNHLVGTYYYPWHGENFHKGGGYLRKNLIPRQQPALGEYNDSQAEVIAQHMKWFRQANIGLLVTSWWGPNRIEDSNTKNVILEHEDIGNLQIALHYETTGRIKDDNDMSVPRSDINYMCENYFDHPNYYKINNRPVLVIYVTRVLHRNSILEEALLTMRSEASKCGHNIYLIGDHVFQSAPDPKEPFVPFWYFDAVTNFDVYGSSGQPDGYAGKERVDKYYSEQEKWRDQALEENCQYIPPVSPGYNDRGVRLEKDHPPLSRRLTQYSDEGSLFWYQLKRALPLVSPSVNNMLLVNSFNEWHEDTQIEPVVSAGTVDVFATTQPSLLTGGLEYVAYGELYLDLLRAATSKNIEDTKLFDYLIA